jgi:hypothetical protein
MESVDSIINSTNIQINSHNIILDGEKNIPKIGEENLGSFINVNKFSYPKYDKDNTNPILNFNPPLLKPLPLPVYSLNNHKIKPYHPQINNKLSKISNNKSTYSFRKNLNDSIKNLKVKIAVNEEKERELKKKKIIAELKKEKIIEKRLKNEKCENYEKIEDDIEDELLELNDYGTFFKRDSIIYENAKKKYGQEDYLIQNNVNSENVFESPSSFIMEALVVKQKIGQHPLLTLSNSVTPLSKDMFFFSFVFVRFMF